ncbi:restriction modification system DNA specificity domain protein [Cylindrospermum sp. NIES-4074]|nr:restriction modification system DNA specificity domain protein [Cylindrospermum sp. NIES-4074]
MLPKGWKVKNLSEVAYIQTGIAKGKKEVGDPVTFPYLRVANVQDGYLDLQEIKEITVSKQQIERYLLQYKDILLTEGGDFDKLGRGYIWHGQINPCLHQNHVFAVRTNKDVLLPEFLSVLVSSFYGKKYFLSCAKQTTNLATINSTQLKDFPVLIPPFSEQKKIAEILSSVDEAIASTQAVIDQTRKVKQGLLQQLLTRGIGHTRFKESAIGTIPEQWTVKLLQDLATIQTGLAKGKKIQGDSLKLPYLRVANVQDGYLDLSEIKMIEVAPKDMDRYCLKPGDVLLTEGGDLDKLGRGDIWRGQIEVCLHQNHIFAVRPNFNVLLSEFLAFQTSSNYGKQYFLTCGKQTTNLASINSTQLKNFPVILPPISEQKEIVEVLNSIRSNELAAVQELESLEKLKHGLMQDLLTGRVRVGVTPNQQIRVKDADATVYALKP